MTTETDTLDTANTILAHVVQSLLMAFRYGVITLCIAGAAGVGCRKWPLIKPRAADVFSKETIK